MEKLKQYNWEKLSWIAAIELGFLMVIYATFLTGGEDVRFYYQPFALGCLECGFVPYYVQPLLAPLRFVSFQYVWALWTLLSVSGLLLIARQTRINPVFFMLSFPMIGQFWLGQIDVFICLGALLAIKNRNPYFRGLGIMLLMVKPQLAILTVVFLLIREKRSELWRVLVVPAGLFTLSLLVYGFDWPLDWVANSQNIPDHPWKLASELLWPWGLILLPLPFLFKGRQDGAVVGFLVSSIGMPFFSVYSLVVVLIFDSPWWILPFSYIHRLWRPWLGDDAIQMYWVVPTTMLALYLVRRFGLDQKLVKKLQRTP